MIGNVLSVDLESWVHRNEIDNFRKEKDNGFIVNSTIELLHLFDKYNVNTTFFIVAEIYDWYPELIEEISERGHEIGYHTHSHNILNNKNILLREIKKSHSFLKKFKPTGFRAPMAFLTEDCIEIISEYGFEYDSSIYGPFELCGKVNDILEIPVSTYKFRGSATLSFPRNLTLNLLTTEIPFGSGYFTGLLGSRISYFIKKLNAKNMPAIIFTHPWQTCTPPNQYKNCLKLFPFKINMVPYYINCYKAIESLLRNHKFYTFSELKEEIDNCFR